MDIPSFLRSPLEYVKWHLRIARCGRPAVTTIKLDSFGGIIPRLADKSLPEKCATVAINTDLRSGAIVPAYDLGTGTTLLNSIGTVANAQLGLVPGITQFPLAALRIKSRPGNTGNAVFGESSNNVGAFFQPKRYSITVDDSLYVYYYYPGTPGAGGVAVTLYLSDGSTLTHSITPTSGSLQSTSTSVAAKAGTFVTNVDFQLAYATANPQNVYYLLAFIGTTVGAAGRQLLLHPERMVCDEPWGTTGEYAWELLDAVALFEAQKKYVARVQYGSAPKGRYIACGPTNKKLLTGSYSDNIVLAVPGIYSYLGGNSSIFSNGWNGWAGTWRPQSRIQTQFITGGSGATETRNYVYTHVNEDGFESAPSPPLVAEGPYGAGATTYAASTEYVVGDIVQLRTPSDITGAVGNPAADTIDKVSHGISGSNPEIYFKANGGTLPGGIIEGRVYFCRDITANTFKIATAPGGPAVDIISPAGSGFTIRYGARWVCRVDHQSPSAGVADLWNAYAPGVSSVSQKWQIHTAESLTGFVNGTWVLGGIPTWNGTDSTGAALTGSMAHKRRIYRTAQVTGTYRLVGELDDNDEVFYDNVAEEYLGQSLSTEGFGDLPQLSSIAAWNGGLLGGVCDGNQVAFCVRGEYHAWPYEQRYTLPAVGMGCGIAGDSFVVPTAKYPVVFQGFDPLTLTMTELRGGEPCISRASVTQTDRGVVYAGTTGWCLLGGGSFDNITRAYLTPEQHRAAATGSYGNDVLHAAFDGERLYWGAGGSDTFYALEIGAAERGLVKMQMPSNLYALGYYADGAKLWAGVDVGGNVQPRIVFGNVSQRLKWTWQSKLFKTPGQVRMAVVQIESSEWDTLSASMKAREAAYKTGGGGSPYTITITGLTQAEAWCYLKVWAEADKGGSKVLVYDDFVVSDRPVYLSRSIKSDCWQFELRGNINVNGFTMAEDEAELNGV